MQKKVRKALNKLAVLTNGHTDGQKNCPEVVALRLK